MPPRHAYWTILIDQRPTAFRAKERDDLLPTVHQLLRTNSDVVMKWFARGRIWDSPEQAEWARRNVGTGPRDQRDREWRPGGEHRDPRARFRKRPSQPRPAPPPQSRAPSEWRPPQSGPSQSHRSLSSRPRGPRHAVVGRRPAPPVRRKAKG